MFNAREGFRRSDDKVPARMTLLPFTYGPKAGALLKAEQQESILDKYYSERGWDEKTSLPNPEKLKALGLDKLV